uniref:Reverse transcriptase domain-containing protein n=1 Tax=Tanacetum cinerariifolium TaxID=118510 RepID=A0A699GT26_TANCI|nr:reverse transcriptase domain-containing protein [Tanacetum cinerariifolium]
MPRECLAIIESKSKVRYSRNKSVVAKVSTNTSASGISPNVAELKDMVKALFLDKESQSSALVKAIEESCVTCGGAHSYRNYPATDGNVYRDNIQEFISQASAVNYNQGNTSYRPLMMSNQIRPPSFPPFVNSNSASTSSSGTLPSHTIANPRSDLKAITTRSYVSYDGPQIPPSTSFLPKVVENKPEVTKNTVNPTNNENTKDVQPPVVQSESPVFNSEPVTSPISEPVIALVSALKPNPKTSSLYPSRRNDERNHEKANNQIEKFYQIFKDMKKLSEMAQTLLNEHCSAVLLKKLPKKLGDPGKFLIPCDFPGMVECLALADLGASINLMPFSVWKRLSLPDLTPTCMTLELADRSISHSVGVTEDVYVKEAITFNLDQTSRYSTNYNDMTAKRIDVIDMACEEYSQEVLGFSDTISSDNPTPLYDPIVSTTSLTLTPFGNSDFLLEEVDTFLAIEDEPTSSKFYQPYLDPEGDILLLESFLNDDPSLPPPNQRNYLPEVHLPPHLEYAFLEGDDKLPVIIANDLSVKEKTALITVLKSHKRAIAWKLSDIKGNQYYCFLDGFSGYFQIPIDLKDQEKTTFTCPYGTFAYRRMPFGLCNAPGTFQRCMMVIFHDMIKKTMEVFMDDFSIFGNSFQSCLSHLERMLKRYEDTNLCLNWEKSHFMVKEAKPMTRLLEKDTLFIFSQECVDAFQTLKRKLIEAPILIAPDWDMPFELMCDASDFAIGAVLGQCQDKHFRPIHYTSKTMTEAESNYTTTEKEMLAVVYAFEKFRSYLILNKSIVYTDHFALKYLFAKKDSKARLIR